MKLVLFKHAIWMQLLLLENFYLSGSQVYLDPVQCACVSLNWSQAPGGHHLYLQGQLS